MLSATTARFHSGVNAAALPRLPLCSPVDSIERVRWLLSPPGGPQEALLLEHSLDSHDKRLQGRSRRLAVDHLGLLDAARAYWQGCGDREWKNKARDTTAFRNRRA